MTSMLLLPNIWSTSLGWWSPLNWTSVANSCRWVFSGQFSAGSFSGTLTQAGSGCQPCSAMFIHVPNFVNFWERTKLWLSPQELLLRSLWRDRQVHEATIELFPSWASSSACNLSTRYGVCKWGLTTKFAAILKNGENDDQQMELGFLTNESRLFPSSLFRQSHIEYSRGDFSEFSVRIYRAHSCGLNDSFSIR